MVVRRGYKNSEVGIIPEEWPTAAIGDMCSCFSGGTPNTSIRRYYDNGTIPWITSSDLNRRRIRDVPAKITPEGLVNSSAKIVERGTVLLALYGATAGVVAVTDIRAAINQAVLALVPKAEDLSSEFLFHYLQFAKEGLVRTYTQGGQPNLSGEIVKAFAISIPSRSEQDLITGALQGADSLLAALDLQIAKKRDLKQAAMQQLLGGRTRLPGFDDDWEATSLGDIALFHKGKGLAKSSLTPYGSEPCVHYGELFTRYGVTIDKTISRTEAAEGAFRSVANDVLMPTSDVTPTGLAKASCVVIDDVVLGGDILVIRTDPALVSGTFLSYIIRENERQVLKLVTGTTVFHLYGSDMKRFIFSLPSLSEQEAIVEVLCDMGAEIAALEVRRDKVKDLRIATMQELLTGKTRLLTPEPSCV